ncbi:FkbM family methyltransferase [Roseovarius mucosus]|uniref:FkbM family methyltransferase n=1 Tax=Roseovarius mucosus TaxID=215743 RepID=UPI0035CFFFD8|tara:strand:- start:1599 stop:3005 length:1407 start_codon:yes stop_codon:yes gene_type:complete
MSEHPVSKTKPRSFIHIGAGTGKRLAELQKHDPDKIVLVEADRNAAARLTQKSASASNVQVIRAALGKEEGDAELSLWNFSRLNSTQEPTPALYELFPGLIRKERQIVPVITPAQLLSEMGTVARPMALILEAPGNEMNILNACKADGMLDQIDQLEILAAEDAFYDGAVTRAELEAWLSDEGFDVTLRDEADADWTVLHLKADQKARALARAQTRIETLRTSLASLETTLSETQAKLKAAKERAELQVAALSEARAATEAKAKTLAERDAALKAAQERVVAIETALTEARAATEAKTKELAERDAALKAEKGRSEDLEAELAEARAVTDAQSKVLAERDAALKAANDKMSGIETSMLDLEKQRHSAVQKRDEAVSTLDFQTRFQAMLQVDLENLRGRLEQSETQRQRQEDLLGKLTAKLSLAAEYLRQLPPSDQESLASDPAQKLSPPRRRSAGKKQKTKAGQGSKA